MVKVKVVDLLEVLRGYPYEILSGDLGELRELQELELVDPENAQREATKELRERLATNGLILLNKRIRLEIYPRVLILDYSVAPHYQEISAEVSLSLAVKGVRDLLRELLERAYHPWWVDVRGVDHRAYVEDGVLIEEDVWVGPFAVVMRDAKLRRGAKVFPFAYVGVGAEIGEESVIMPGAVIMDAVRLGRRVTVLPGAVIGADGFGFVRSEEGWKRLPHLGSVVIGDDVEVGANTTVDRGTLRDTVIERGVKMDNLVHVGHNCHVGENALIIAQVGIAGSVKVGRDVILAGQSGVKDNINIGDGAQIGGGSVVVKDVPPGAKYWGFPAINHAKWVRMIKWLEGQVERRL